MAINIQEILHPSDSDSIKFSKINYNFDQLVVNGGGPAGPKGQQGFQGIAGLTGQQGITGDKGTKGDSGETTSPWKNIAIDLNLSDGKNNVRILKPKPGTDLETPVIWLGDSSFLDEGASSSDGDTTLRSTLNVSRHYNLDTSQVEAEYATFWHSSSVKIKLDSEDVSDNSVNYTRFNLSPVEPIVANSTPEDIRFQINLPTIHTGEFRLNNFNITGNFEAGMLRYNSGGNKFEGYINNAWVELCTAPCGTGSNASISISGTNLSLLVDGTLSGVSPTFQYSNWTGSVSVNAAGVVSIANGNASTVVTDPVGPVAANNTAGTNGVTFTVTVTVPSGYNNVGNTVAGSVTVTQPTSYVAPNIETFILNLQEGASSSNWGFTADGGNLVTANSNGATENSYNLNAGGAALSIDALGGTVIQISVTGDASSGREFLANALAITNGGGLTYSIASQTLSNNDTTATAVIDITLPGSGSTTNFNFEASTTAITLAGTYNYRFADSDINVCDDAYSFGGGATLQPVTVAFGATTSDWYDAAVANAASAHANSAQFGTGGWIKILLLKDENGAILGPMNDEAWQVSGGGTTIGAAVPCATATTTLPTFTNAIANLVVPNGTEGDPVTGTPTVGTLGAGVWNPQNYTVGISTYSHSVTAPSGYDNAGNDVACNDTGVTVTALPTQTYNFDWVTPGNVNAQNYMQWDNHTGDNIMQFNWEDVTGGYTDGPALTSGFSGVSDFDWYNWTGMDSTLSFCYVSDSSAGAAGGYNPHTGGSGYVKFFFSSGNPAGSAPNQPVGQSGGSNNGTEVTFDGSYTLDPNSITGAWVVLQAYCHLAGTVMNLADGTTKLVEDLEAGDVLKSYSITGLGTDENEQPPSSYTANAAGWSAVESTTTVTFVNEGTYNKYVNFNNGLTKVTHEHPVLTKAADGGISFKKAGEVVNGDSFYINGAWVEVTNIDIVTPEVDFATYTIGVEDQDIYVADGVVWHNVPGGNK